MTKFYIRKIEGLWKLTGGLAGSAVYSFWNWDEAVQHMSILYYMKKHYGNGKAKWIKVEGAHGIRS